jgi:hypothetical protein
VATLDIILDTVTEIFEPVTSKVSKRLKVVDVVFVYNCNQIKIKQLIIIIFARRQNS